MRKLLVALALLFYAAVAQAQVPVALSPVARQQFLDANAKPLAGGKVCTFNAGTTTPAASYVDIGGIILNTNPIVLDSGGFATIYLASQSYKITVYDGSGNNSCPNSGVQQWSQDNVNAFQPITGALSIIFAGVTSDPAGTAGQVDYRSDIPCFRSFTTVWDCFVRLNDAQTITNKTVVSPVITGSVTGGATYVAPILTTPVINGASTGTGLQGTDAKLLTAGAVGAAGNVLCSDANGGASTANCTPVFQGVSFPAGTYTNATTTFSNVTGLVFNAAANTNYRMSCDIFFQGSAATAGPKFQFTGPAAPTTVLLGVDGANAITGVDNFVQAFSTPNVDMGTIAASARNFIARVVLILQNGANAGNVQLQAAANGAGTLTIFGGSSCSLQTTN